MSRGAAGTFLRTLCRLSTRFLAAAGVLSAGCYQAAEPSYGVPAVNVTLNGSVRSAADSTAIEGIRLMAFSPSCSLFVGEGVLTDQNGTYHLFLEDYGLFDTDSIGIVADDVDGDLNGAFLSADTVMALPQEEEPVVIADIYLQPAEN